MKVTIYRAWRRRRGAWRPARAAAATLVVLGMVPCADPAFAADPAPLIDDDGGLVVPPVVVTGTRRDVPIDDSPVRVDVVDAEEIAASGARDAAEVLETRLGVEIARTFRGAGAQVEGLDPRHVLILVDGVRVAGKTGEQVDLSRIPAESIARIEVVKGAGSALYGSDALGGIIHIITKRAERPAHGSVSASYGSGDTVDLTGDVGVRDGAWDARLSAGWHRFDAYALDASPATSGSARDDVGVTLDAGVAASDTVRVEARAQYLYRRLEGVDAQTLPPTFEGEPRWKVTDRVQTTHTASGLLRATWAPSPTQDLEADLSVSYIDDLLAFDQRGSDREDRDETTSELVGQLNLRYRTLIGFSHVLSTGLEGQVDTLESARVDAGEADRQRVGAYAQDEWTLVEDPALVLVPAVRLDYDTQFGVAVTPRLAARLDPAERVTIRADVGLGYRAPGFKELYLLFENPSVGYRVVGNPDLEPERSVGTRGGVDWRATKGVTLGATYFRHDVDDLILTVGLDADTFTYVNVDSATSQGVETRVTLGPFEGLRLDLGYTFTDARDDATGDPLVGRSRHRGTVGLDWHVRATGTRLNARLAVAGERPIIDPNDADARLTAAPYALLDARLAQTLPGDVVTLFVGLDNALDVGDPVGNPIRPRRVYAGLSARL